MQRVRSAELLTALLIRQLDPTAFPDSLQEFGPWEPQKESLLAGPLANQGSVDA